MSSNFAFRRLLHLLPAFNSPPGPLQDKPVWGINQLQVRIQAETIGGKYSGGNFALLYMSELISIKKPFF